MSKLAHSSQEHMDEIERREQDAPCESDAETIRFMTDLVEEIARVVDPDAFTSREWQPGRKQARLKATEVVALVMPKTREFFR